MFSFVLFTSSLCLLATAFLLKSGNTKQKKALRSSVVQMPLSTFIKPEELSPKQMRMRSTKTWRQRRRQIKSACRTLVLPSATQDRKLQAWYFLVGLDHRWSQFAKQKMQRVKKNETNWWVESVMLVLPTPKNILVEEAA